MSQPVDIPQCEHYKAGTQCPNTAHRWDAPSLRYLCLDHYLEAVKHREYTERKW